MMTEMNFAAALHAILNMDKDMVFAIAYSAYMYIILDGTNHKSAKRAYCRHR